jgi:hypothetical protein
MKVIREVLVVRKSILYLWILFLSVSIPSCSDNQKEKIEIREQTTEVKRDQLPTKGPYFMVDKRTIEDRWMIERFTVALQKHPNNPVLVKELPWEGTGPLMGGTVIFDPQDELFKMWYLV